MAAIDQSFAGLPQLTKELMRILAIPRRSYPKGEIDRVLVPAVSDMLRRPGGTMTLRPIQAQSLFELGASGGLFAPIAVAGGKTLTSLLAPTITGARRPLLLVPAKLAEKTRRDWLALDPHWQIYPGIRIVSYELLSRAQGAQLIRSYQPDLIILDECHKAKNTSGTVARRIERYMRESPETKLAAMTGTISKRSIKDYAHILRWALKHQACPLPCDFHELEAWAAVLDEPSGAWKKAGEVEEPDPGALRFLLGPSAPESLPVSRIRLAYQDRLRSVRGVVTSEDSGTGIPIIVEREHIRPPVDVSEAVRRMRDTWETPDGVPFLDAVSMWRHCRELSLGFFYRWDPPAPPAWSEARSVWAKWCRQIIQYGRRECDSELQAIQAVDAGHYPDAAPALAAWRAVRDTFQPRSVPVWLSDYLIRDLSDRLVSGPECLYWVEHSAFGAALSAASKVPYYGAEAKSASGASILQHRQGPAICSIKSVGEGFNLQRFHRNLIVSPPTNGPQWEQLLGRTDREGQKADEILCSVLVACEEHENAIQQALADARYIERTSGMQQKILKADWV